MKRIIFVTLVVAIIVAVMLAPRLSHSSVARPSELAPVPPGREAELASTRECVKQLREYVCESQTIMQKMLSDRNKGK